MYKDPVIVGDDVYGPGSGLIFNVDCTRESCSFVPANCSHSSDVGVICKRKQAMPFVRTYFDES